MSDLVLDHLEPFALPAARSTEFANHLRYLGDCRLGLGLLAGNMARLESVVASRLPPADKVRTCGFGNLDFLQGIPMPLVNGMFDWFAVSACNFVRVVGSIREAVTAESATSYLERVLPVEKTFRDKVGAHPVGASQNKKDNAADRQHSFFPQASWDSGRFWGGALKLTMGIGGSNVQSAAVPWSVTDSFERLARRYWPSA